MTTQSIQRQFREMIADACKRLAAQRIWVFGSRARGDSREFSDIDFAFDFPVENTPSWAAFVIDWQARAPSLLELDFVDLRTASPPLIDSILREGKLIYAASHQTVHQP